MVFFRTTVYFEKQRKEESDRIAEKKNEKETNSYKEDMIDLYVDQLLSETEENAADHFAAAVCQNTDLFNLKNSPRAYCFVYEVRNDRIHCGMIIRSPKGAMEKMKEFLNCIGIHYDKFDMDEILTIRIRRHLLEAQHAGFLFSSDEPEGKFGFDSLPEDLDYGEELLNDFPGPEESLSIARFLQCGQTLCAELDRIRQGSSQKSFVGHPVHYLLEINNPKVRDEVCSLLLQNLYTAGRIVNKRYSICDIGPGKSCAPDELDALYHNSQGGSVVIRFRPGSSEEQNESAAARKRRFSDEAVMPDICRMILKYRNSVQTLFCLPRSCERTKRLLLENSGSLPYVGLSEDRLDFGQSCTYLDKLSRQRHVRRDKKLFQTIDENGSYYPEDLQKAFDAWLNTKIRESVFPQYKNIQTANAEPVMKKEKGKAYRELNRMIGLREAKRVIGKALNFYKIQKLIRERGLGTDRPAMHMVFTGNPGTAKTTVARLLASILYDSGLLSKGHIVETGRADLVGKYVGWTAPTIQKRFAEARGGVLFIDEAYSLVDDRDGSFGDEAINTIVQEMENHRNDVIVIFAGYPEKMETFLEKNPGLRSRIAFHIPFEDYNTSELCEIAQLIGESQGLSFTENAVRKMSTLLEWARLEPDFGNGRYCRNLIDLARMNHADRISAMEFSRITDPVLTTLEEEDIEAPDISRTQKTVRIGFAV